MITWSQKEEILLSRERIQNAEDDVYVLKYLVEYIELIQTIPEINRAISKGFRIGPHNSKAKEVFKLVKSGHREDDGLLIEAVGESSLFQNSRLISSQLGFLIEGVEVGSNKIQIIIDLKNSEIRRDDDSGNKMLITQKDGKRSNRIKMILKIKSEKSMSTSRLAKDILSTSEVVRKEIKEINKRFRFSIIDSDLIIIKKKEKRQNIYTLNPEFEYR